MKGEGIDVIIIFPVGGSMGSKKKGKKGRKVFRVGGWCVVPS